LVIGGYLLNPFFFIITAMKVKAKEVMSEDYRFNPCLADPRLI
jgi:hypothetical protein